MKLGIEVKDIMSEAFLSGILVHIRDGVGALCYGTVTRTEDDTGLPYVRTYRLCLVPEELVDDGSGGA